jgi:hypothetical protein
LQPPRRCQPLQAAQTTTIAALQRRQQQLQQQQQQRTPPYAGAAVIVLTDASDHSTASSQLSAGTTTAPLLTMTTSSAHARPVGGHIVGTIPPGRVGTVRLRRKTTRVVQSPGRLAVRSHGGFRKRPGAVGKSVPAPAPARFRHPARARGRRNRAPAAPKMCCRYHPLSRGNGRNHQRCTALVAPPSGQIAEAFAAPYGATCPRGIP